MTDVRTDTAPAAAPDRPDQQLIGQPPLSTTASIVAGGHLAWLGWLWVTVAVVFAVAIGIISAAGQLDESLWSNAVAGWQRWVLGGAGAFTTVSFLPILVGNGLTRGSFARSVLAGGGALAVAATAFIVLGYVLEGFAYDANDWSHVIGAEGDEPLAGLGVHLRIALDHLLTLSAYFVSGWLAGMAWHRSRAFAAAAILPCLVPIAVAETFLRGESGADVVDGWSFDPSLAVGAPLTLAVVAVAAWIGTRVAGELELRPGSSA